MKNHIAYVHAQSMMQLFLPIYTQNELEMAFITYKISIILKFLLKITVRDIF